MVEDRKPPFWFLRRGRRIDSEVDEELQLHLEMRVEALRRRGASEEEARREALRQFGDLPAARAYCANQDRIKERTMMRTLRAGDLVHDVRLSIRTLFRAPVLALTIVLTVGLGIGATTAMFGAVEAAFLRPLPYADPDRLVWLYTDDPPFQFRFSAVDVLALDAQRTQFESVAGFTNRTMTYADRSAAEVLRGRTVTWSYFGTLGIPMMIGRDFGEIDGRPGSPAAVILNHAFWRDRLGARADIAGSTIRLDGADHTVVGVLPAAVGPLEARQDVFVAAQIASPS